MIRCTDEVKSEISGSEIYDLFICLDCGDAKRLGFAEPLFENAKETFCIDHHVTNSGIARINHILPQASSTCEVLFDLLEEEKITKACAEALYTGVIHDTGVFQYSNTSQKTMQIGG